ncbi:MAG TPA: Xaa-Pro peptidase family protein [Conexibacter sp.]|jgi:Xaa-Pro aminopeptidase
MPTTASTTGRADRLAELLPARELDALLVTNLVNVRYLTGYTGSNGLAVVGERVRRFVTDFRYVTQAQDQVHGFDRVIGETDLLDQVATGLPDGPLRLGFDDQTLSVRTHRRLRELLPERVDLVPAGGLVEELRLVKDAAEVAQVRAAAVLADEAVRTVVMEGGLIGRTEREVALAIEHEMQRLGAQAAGFPTIVAHAGHGALPHATPREVKIAAGSLVVVDWGAELDGYFSDCTRTYAAGEVDAQAREVYELVRTAQLAGLAAVGPGVTARDADAAARDLIEAAGHGERFGHSLGHGVGMEIHEGPRLSKQSTATLAPGYIVTVEPGVYLPDVLGVRIEDLVLVTDNGHEVLSGLPKDLTDVG